MALFNVAAPAQPKRKLLSEAAIGLAASQPQNTGGVFGAAKMNPGVPPPASQQYGPGMADGREQSKFLDSHYGEAPIQWGPTGVESPARIAKKAAARAASTAGQGLGATLPTPKSLNPYETANGVLTQQRTLQAVASKAAFDASDMRSNAVNNMLAGGGLLSQGALNGMNNDVSARMLGQQSGLAADYMDKSARWNENDRTQRRLDEMQPYAIADAALRNKALNSEVYLSTTQEAMGDRAGMLHNAAVRDAGATTRDGLATTDANRGTYEGNETSLSRMDGSRAASEQAKASTAQILDATTRAGITFEQGQRLEQLRQEQAPWMAIGDFLKAALKAGLVVGGAVAGGLAAGAATGGLGMAQGAAAGAAVGGAAAGTF